MKTRLALAIACLLALILSLAPACIADDSANLPTWKPDPKIVAGLGQEIVIDGSAFRIPQTVTLTESRTDNNAQLLKWRGSPTDIGIRPMFMVIELPLDTLSESDSKEARANVSGVSAALVRQLDNITANMISEEVNSSLQHGKIGNETFSRQYFKGYNHRWLREVHGFTYPTVTSKAAYAFLVFDLEPLSKYSLPISEAAVQTFHPSDKPNTPMPDNLIDPEDVKDTQNQSDE